MEQFFSNIITIFQNAFIVMWYWMNTYKWELVLFIALAVVVVFEIQEASVHFVDDERKVV